MVAKNQRAAATRVLRSFEFCKRRQTTMTDHAGGD